MEGEDRAEVKEEGIKVLQEAALAMDALQDQVDEAVTLLRGP